MSDMLSDIAGQHPFAHTGFVSVMDAWKALSNMTKQKNELEQRILHTASFINAHTLINRLPTEILVEIFFLTHPRCSPQLYIDTESSSNTRDLPWYPMVAVCRYWRSIVHGTPRLWWLVHVTNTTTLDAVEHTLSMSGTQSVDVIIEDCDDIKDFMDELLRRRPRINLLHVQNVPCHQGEYIETFVHKPLPALRTLQLWFDPTLFEFDVEDDRFANAQVFDQGQYHLPQLSKLSLRGVGLQGPLPGLGDSVPSLTRLELRDSISPDCNIFEFMEFLKLFPELESLTLARFRPWDDGFDDMLVDLDSLGPLPIVTFTPKLQRLHLEDIDLCVARMLSGFAVPVSTTVTIVKLVSPNDAMEPRTLHQILAQPLDSCLPTNKTGLPIVGQITGARIAWFKTSVQFVAATGKATISIGMKNALLAARDADQDIPHAVTRLLAQSPLVNLCIDGLGRSKFSIEQWSLVFKQLPRLRTLAVFTNHRANRSRNNVKAFLDALALTQPDGTPLCPNLEELYINNPSLENDAVFASVLKARLQRRSARLRSLYYELDPAPVSNQRSPPSLEFVHAAEAIRATLEGCAEVVHCSYERCERLLEDELMNLMEKV
ncbi:hypothetical protein C8Q76DRAFT_801572 [Earliella scabrosa]|nr:hypothetical protein C8Q76DRAFT_801572 [Earliella scabrosa]